MANNVELRKIKKRYGEKFMHMCRDLFPTILEQEGALFSILENTFATNSRTLYEDIHNNKLEESFRKFIFDKVNITETTVEIVETKTPYELLDEAGYTLYECKNEKEIQEFKKYYASGEHLCTFRGGRLNSCVVFFAVKKNVDEIKRDDFIDPKREDEYGTSVISIQFFKEGLCTVSIKNRYNHTVNNPDATYGNDLDRIIPGLSQSFENLLLERGLQLSNSNIEKFSIPSYVVASDGRYYKYNVELLGRYYCPGNIIIEGGNVIKLGNPERQILVDMFIIDLEHKTIQSYQSPRAINVYDDSFPITFKDSIEKIEVVRDKERPNGERVIRIKKKDTDAKIEIRINKDNQMIEYINEELDGVRENFLRCSIRLKRLVLPNLKNTGSHFLASNTELEYLELPKLRVAHESFLVCNLNLVSLDLPELIQAKDSFLYHNTQIAQVNFPKLKAVGNGFLGNNRRLKRLELPCINKAGNNFLGDNQDLEYLFAPNLSMVGRDFLYHNIGLEELELPSLLHAGRTFLRCNSRLKNIKVNNTKILEEAENKRLLLIQKGLVSPKMLAKLDKKGKLTDFEIKLAERFIKMRDFINKHKQNGESKEQ